MRVGSTPLDRISAVSRCSVLLLTVFIAGISWGSSPRLTAVTLRRRQWVFVSIRSASGCHLFCREVPAVSPGRCVPAARLWERSSSSTGQTAGGSFACWACASPRSRGPCPDPLPWAVGPPVPKTSRGLCLSKCFPPDAPQRAFAWGGEGRGRRR